MLGWSTHAAIIYSPANPINVNIPDGNPSGWSGTATASGFLPTISDIQVKLNIGGPSPYNGDLYVYISYGGVLVPLLNRVGVTATGGGNSFGYGDTGFNVTLSSAGANDVHFYQNYSPSFNGSGQLTGTWQPDGRAIDPQSSPSAFDSASRVNFGSYNGMNPNGTWTLFIADLSAGGQSELLSWELDITAVPEPVNVALGIFAVVFLAITLASRLRVRKLLMLFSTPLQRQPVEVQSHP
jgi:subtilisin-like proprotein convertase family protein